MVESIQEQAERAYKQFSGFESAMDKHVYLRNIQDTNETLFYRLVDNHLEEMMPIIYTPTVGAACQQFSISTAVLAVYLSLTLNVKTSMTFYIM